MTKILKLVKTRLPVLVGTLLLASFAGNVNAAGQATKPSICNRSCWNARSAPLNTNMSALNRAIIHHTAGAGDYNVSNIGDSKAKVRAVQNLHMDVNGWSDIGYHYLFDKLGNAFAGRRNSDVKSEQRRGAHDGTNTNSFGFTCLGYYHPPYNNTLTAAQKDTLYDVIAWRMPDGWSPYGASTYNGKNVGKVDGHRDVKATACPGDKIYNKIIGTNHNAGEIRDEIWERIQGLPGLHAAPDVVSREVGRMDVVARGTNDQLIHIHHDQGVGWSSWVNRGGDMKGGPAILSKNPDHMEIFFRGTNDSLQNKWWTSSGGWTSGWNQVGSANMMDSGCDAVSRENGRMDIVARGYNDQLIHKSHEQGVGWSNWTNRGGDFKGEPSICSKNADHLEVFVRGKDDALWNKWWTQTGGWSSWNQIGLDGKLTSAPDAVSRDSGRMDVVARGDSGQIIHKSHVQGQGWSNWTNLGTKVFSSGATICSKNPDHLQIFARGTEGALWSKYYVEGSGWSSWNKIGPDGKID